MNIFSQNKVLKHLDTLNKYIEDKEYPPILVEIDLTNKCTSDCPWCFGFVDRKWRKDTLFAKNDPDKKVRMNSSKQGVANLLKDLALIGVKAITWTGGGDPSCHEGLIDFLKLSHNLGMQNGLITNGVIPVKDALPYCTWIRFSVDGASEEVYGTQHGKPKHFKSVLENIKNIAQVKNDCGYETTLGVAFVTHKETKDEIIDFAKLWKHDKGIDYIQYRPLLDKYGESWFTDNLETVELIKKAKEIEPRVVYSEPKYDALIKGLPGQTKYCHGTFLEAAIAADGKVYTCCHMKGKPKYAHGDLYEESFPTVWKRHLKNKKFKVNNDCPKFCRHYGTNLFIEEEIIKERQHENFI